MRPSPRGARAARGGAPGRTPNNPEPSALGLCQLKLVGAGCVNPVNSRTSHRAGSLGTEELAGATGDADRPQVAGSEEVERLFLGGQVVLSTHCPSAEPQCIGRDR